MSRLMAFFLGVCVATLSFVILISVIVPPRDEYRVIKIGDRMYVKSELKYGTVIGFDGKAPIIRLDTDRIFTTEIPEKK